MSILEKKLSIVDIFNCNDFSGFIELIREKLPFEGYSGNSFYRCIYEDIPFLVKLAPFNKQSSEIYERTNKINQSEVEIKVLEVLKKKFIQNNITPCIIELVYSKICDNIVEAFPNEELCEELTISHRRSTISNDINEWLCDKKLKADIGLSFNKCAFLILEECDMTFDSYLRDNKVYTSVNTAIIKSLLFQIIYTLYSIKRVYPEFSHNDLHVHNIMLKFDREYRFKPAVPKYLTYIIDGEMHYVPYFGIIPKIIDYSFASIPEENIQSVYEDEIPYKVSRPVGSDIIFLFFHINYILDTVKSEGYTNVKKILTALDPHNLHTRSFVYTNHHKKLIPTMQDLVKNPIWNEYKKVTVQKSNIFKEYTPVDMII